ncbi:hypothetical protein KAFR_0C04640 [Kazachstania africana CBS 2517]|uniref:Uncharacterized protein n=1 Tax=Kazachstania africana (strain ATCC 22294 / BCRC 22015 / CBS 2517 / CECT 1963 / NBRC 1671 / NRRL Y-8276) TaxID=1071382 RepID=H2ASV5_KAZAF|nr:hypothetical protein KAFR_0C04640 [Kazachstania africana CBS 2517]CCF57455.1 hypothetical protein KAFR_0C04640 [Kazachstania africana CBS 2517]
MFWLVLFGCVFTVCTSVLTTDRYFSFKMHKNTFPFVLLILTLNMMLLLGTDFLLPFDVFQASAVGSNGHTNKPLNETTVQELSHLRKRSNNVRFFEIIWPLIYWLQFAFCWFLIPVGISYISLKYALPRDDRRERFIKSILQNVKFYSLCLLGIIIGSLYLIMSTGHNLLEFKSLIITLSHLYSLSYTLILLSTGLIILPRDLINSVKVPSAISNNKLFVVLSKTNDDVNDSQLNLVDNADLILSSNELNNGDVTFNQLLNECKIEIESKLDDLKISTANRVSTELPKPITNLRKLNSTYNKFINHYYNYIYYQNHSNSIIHTLAQTQSNSINNLKKIAVFIIGLIATILSFLIIICEILPKKMNFLDKWLFHNGDNYYNFLIIFTILSYNTISSLYAMSKFKFNNFHLISNGNSNPSNVFYYSLYSSRLLFPLCFNLITLLPNNQKRSTFQIILFDRLNVIPLVKFLNNYLPMIFMVLIPLSYRFDLKQKILLNILGEEFYYQFFGMMLYDPLNEPTSTNAEPAVDAVTEGRYNMNEDYEYSLQDGKYLFERASTQFNLNVPGKNIPLNETPLNIYNDANPSRNTSTNNLTYL